VFQPQSVHLSSNISWPKVEVELSIPRNPKAGLHLVSGDSIGWNIHYGKVLNKPENWSTTFDQHAFVYFDLIDEQAAATEKQEIARKLRLKQNYPNPFNPSTRITYSLPQSRGVSLKVYDLLGREVATLVDGNQKAGQHTVRFNADHLSSGIYFYRLRAGGETKIRKMTLVK